MYHNLKNAHGPAYTEERNYLIQAQSKPLWRIFELDGLTGTPYINFICLFEFLTTIWDVTSADDTEISCQ
jgi:hypothetical protein